MRIKLIMSEYLWTVSLRCSFLELTMTQADKKRGITFHWTDTDCMGLNVISDNFNCPVPPQTFLWEACTGSSTLTQQNNKFYLNLTGNPPYSGTKGNFVHSYNLRNHSANQTYFLSQNIYRKKIPATSGFGYWDC